MTDESGSGKSRVQAFLLSSLAASTQKKYEVALAFLALKCEDEEVEFNGLDEEEQDWFLAEFILDGHLGADKKWQYSELLSALARVNPRSKYKVAHRVLDVWTRREPPHQAPACPPEILTMACMLLILVDRPTLGVGFMVCYAGLLRIREMLSLVWADVHFSSAGVVLCLGVTKRGREQKVCLAHPTVVFWLNAFRELHGGAANQRVFEVGYATALKWFRRAVAAVGFDEPVTTHSLRRSGASELSRLGVPWQDIMDFGRWNSDRAAREYVRRGEVAVHRSRAAVTLQGAGTLTRAGQWASQAHNVWKMKLMLHLSDMKAVNSTDLLKHVELLNVVVQSCR